MRHLILYHSLASIKMIYSLTIAPCAPQVCTVLPDSSLQQVEWSNSYAQNIDLRRIGFVMCSDDDIKIMPFVQLDGLASTHQLHAQSVHYYMVSMMITTMFCSLGSYKMNNTHYMQTCRECESHAAYTYQPLHVHSYLHVINVHLVL